MCGITGYFSNNGIPFKAFAQASSLIKHRGPDDYGYLVLKRSFSVFTPKTEDLLDVDSTVAEQAFGILGFRRLAIIDLSSKGHQPMTYQDGKYWLIFNGEIYNYLELRKELSAKGYQFHSGSDTEVILAAYSEWGVDCLQRFNGMWAIALLDIEKKQLFCARDRLGIKPFYYYYNGKEFGFGSEVKQLLEIFPNLRRANRKVLFDFLAIGSYGNETDETFFEDVYRLPAGSYFLVDLKNNIQIQAPVKYWDLPSDMIAPKSETEIHETIYELLSDSIRLRLRSDVPLGICLSGGLDSSGISMLAAEQRNGSPDPMKLFTIGSLDPKIDETHYARLISENTHSQHLTKIPDSNDLADELTKFIWHHDEPLIKASMFGGYHVYKLAKESGTTVVLDGQGADELMGGYNFGIHYPYLGELLSNLSLGQLIKELRSNASLYQTNNLKVTRNLFSKTLKKAIRPILSRDYQPGFYKKTKGWLKNEFVMDSIPHSVRLNKEYLSKTDTVFNSAFKQDSFELIRFTNLPGILRQVDRNSMAFSVEARVPFLDHRLVEYLFSLPAKYHLRGGYTKYSYRKSMEGRIPDSILWRTDKQGFSMPDRLLLKGASEYVSDIIAQIPSNSAVYDKQEIEKIFKHELQSDANYRPIYWRVINALVWQDIFKTSV